VIGYRGGPFMKSEGFSPQATSAADSPGIKVATIYEDFATGAWAHAFAGKLVENWAAAGTLSNSLWRSELLEWPAIAADAALAVADCDFLIVSLRGNRMPVAAVRRWIEANLKNLAARNAALIVLLDPRQATRSVIAGARYYFRSVCAAKGVTFYSHTVMPPSTGAVTKSGGNRRTAGFTRRRHATVDSNAKPRRAAWSAAGHHA
jgi:hypothetical protein